MKILKFILVFLFVNVFAQKEYPIIVLDSLRDALIDDYDNLYAYRNSDLSILKYDSTGVKKAEIKFPQPFKIQSVENPLNIFLFSENGQEIKILDQNLNQIEYFNLFGKFGHIKAVYSEDLQYLWILDSAQRKLVQYNHRDDRLINSFPFKIDFEKITDFLVYEGKIYILKEKSFSIYDFDAKQVYSIDINSGRKLRREDDKIFVIEKDRISIFKYSQELVPVFSNEKYKIVDKNYSHFLALKDDIFYLYKIEK